MGNKYEVWVWTTAGRSPVTRSFLGDEITYEDYRYEEYWHGEWLVLALYKLFQARLTGAGCVKFEWR